MSILIPLSRIEDSPWQTRQAYDQEHIEELAADIERNGLLQPPVGRMVDTDGQPKEVGSFYRSSKAIGAYWNDFPGHRVQLAFGHNRFRAMQLLERQGDPSAAAMDVELRNLSDERMATLAWTENERRKDLTPVEEALAIQRRMQDFDWTQQQVAEELGIGRSTVANKLRLMKLPDEVLQHVKADELSERQAVALVPAFQLSEDDRAVNKRISEWWRIEPEGLVEEAKKGASSKELRKRTKEMKKRIAERRETDQEKRERKAQLEKQFEEANEADGEMLQLSDLNYSDYADVSDDPEDWRYQEGCSPDCKCRTMALSSEGEAKKICTDPEHRRSMKRQLRREAKERRREEAAEKLDAFREKYTSGGQVQWTPAAVRLIAWAALRRPNAKDTRGALDELKEAGVIDEAQREALDGLAGGTWSNREPGLDALEELGMETVLRLLHEALIRRDLRGYVDNDFSTDDYDAVMAGEPYGTEKREKRLAHRKAARNGELSALELGVLRKANDGPHFGTELDEFKSQLSEKERGAVGRLLQLDYLREAGDGWITVTQKTAGVLKEEAVAA